MARFNEEAVRFAVWSMSKASAAFNCPFRFQLKYVKKKKGHSVRSSAGRLGIAAHSAIEHFLKGMDIKEALRRSAIDEKLTTPEIQALLAFAHSMREFKGRIDAFAREQGVTETHIERKFGLTIDMKPTKFFTKATGPDAVFFRGVWDLCLRAKGKYIIIIDHKSGAVKSDGEGNASLGESEEQLNLYAVAALSVFPDVAGVQSALHYMQSGEIVWDDMRSAEEIKDTLYPWYYSYLNRAAKEALSPAARRGWYCSFCEYTDLCPMRG
jgi:hypothetical protein